MSFRSTARDSRSTEDRNVIIAVKIAILLMNQTVHSFRPGSLFVSFPLIPSFTRCSFSFLILRANFFTLVLPLLLRRKKLQQMTRVVHLRWNLDTEIRNVFRRRWSHVLEIDEDLEFLVYIDSAAELWLLRFVATTSKWQTSFPRIAAQPRCA